MNNCFCSYKGDRFACDATRGCEIDKLLVIAKAAKHLNEELDDYVQAGVLPPLAEIYDLEEALALAETDKP